MQPERLLSQTKLPKASIAAILLFGTNPAKLAQDLRNRGRQRTFDGTTTGTLVTASTETLGNGRNIELTFTAQADAASPVGQFAKT